MLRHGICKGISQHMFEFGADTYFQSKNVQMLNSAWHYLMAEIHAPSWYGWHRSVSKPPTQIDKALIRV